ncbi:MAG TPA: hypothetical protein PLO37_04660 [Candidatus Hydrogenedentes bacterium]|nr:hypothetical protein [Candidatus Hydrogenedentota bacterium]HPG66117.1 hypothetical protein [Candidatus Hydrogenedentota bacterium]
MIGTIIVTLALSMAANGEFDLGTARLSIDAHGCARLYMRGETELWSSAARPILEAERGGERLPLESISVEDDLLIARFPGGGMCEFAVHAGDGFAVFDLVRLAFAPPIDRLRLFSIALPEGAEVMGTLNAGSTATHIVALSAAEPNVHAFTQSSGRHESDRVGCTHELVFTEQAQVGAGAARFLATCDAQAGGWSVSPRPLWEPIDLTGITAIRAWIHGDGKGELLKIQLYDGLGGYRDTYVPIDFEGWRQVTIAESAVNTLRLDHVAALNLYYNGLPANETVTCIVDQIEAILDHEGEASAVLLEDFEAASAYWAGPTTVLNVETGSSHGLQPARFGLIASPREGFMSAMQRFEGASGLPSPKPGGTWNKESPWIKRSYLFITGFRESQFDSVLALARRGGFDMILMGQESWAKATGHYEINTDHFPGGLDALARTFQRFREAGFHVGLHFLGPSIYPPDPYLTPVPDPRLFKDAAMPLADGVGAQGDFLPTGEPPETFPAEDGGYHGDGAVVQIGDELIQYAARSMEVPFGFSGCTRGILGTLAAPHAAGDSVMHLKKSYGYYLFDMDTSLLDEVSTNFARVANACDIDMIYFDGSERLQGDHWYYNARLHKAFFDKLARKDILIQASSFSHYSWHILARSASADGHGDLKGYLDERSAWLDAFKRNAMPLDIGWYYGYDTMCTPDMYEYVLGASIGYDSSISFQVSFDAASRHPFTGEILDLIARYERLRLSGRIPEDVRAHLRIDPALAGEKTAEERAALLELRREYRLVTQDGADALQRVVYEPWHEIGASDAEVCTWPVRVIGGPARVGVQIHAMPGPWFEAGPSYQASEAVILESFDDLAPYLQPRGDRSGVREIPNGEAGATLEGVAHHIGVSEEDAKAGGRCAVYSAESTRGTDDGWSVFGKSFDPPLDLSSHRALGFWLRGDGHGGLFKLQLLDGAQAADFYVTNNYTGWRYQQLPRPESDPIDYSQVRTLNFYYNGLPARSIVACAIDDVKAMPAVDSQRLVDPWADVGGHRFDWRGELSAGQYVFLWPGEVSRCYGPAFTEPVMGAAPISSAALPVGEYAVRFGCADGLVSPVRIRVTLQPEEGYRIP